MRRTSLAFKGHSKWANIKHKKGANDAKRNKLFTKLVKTVEVASRMCGGDRDNSTLASALARAKAGSVPKEKMEAAVLRGAKKLTSSENVEMVQYEGMLPGGIGFVLEALTDNRSRTAQDVRAIFKKHGGALGTENSVSYNWTRSGVLKIDGEEGGGEELLEAAIEAGADEVVEDENLVYVDPKAIASTRDFLQKAGWSVASIETVWRPTFFNEITDEEKQQKILNVVEAFEDQQDVTAVYHDAS